MDRSSPSPPPQLGSLLYGFVAQSGVLLLTARLLNGAISSRRQWSIPKEWLGMVNFFWDYLYPLVGSMKNVSHLML
ncbi:hypothetical protein I3843_10G123400 [Carya illinoinensis]|nr:hypothetical protein I3843_10G123400 [Carya illinoinensis]